MRTKLNSYVNKNCDQKNTPVIIDAVPAGGGGRMDQRKAGLTVGSLI